MRTIAVVIPLYNKGPHIRDTLSSVLSQTYSPTEIIVIDDGSSDEGPATVASMAAQDERIRLLRRSPPGPGGYAARNLGIESASSELIAFLDADDIWHADHLHFLCEAIEMAGPSAGCGFSAVQIVEVGKRYSYRGTTRDIPVATPLPFEVMLKIWLASGQCPIWTGASIFRRSVLVDAGLFPAGRARRGGDKDMWLRAIARSHTAFSGRETAEFHQDTVNRVTKSTTHSSIPILIESAMGLMATVPSNTQVLLKKLVNQELAQYSKHSARAAIGVDSRFFRAYQYDAGIIPSIKMLCYAIIGNMLALKRLMFENRSKH